MLVRRLVRVMTHRPGSQLPGGGARPALRPAACALARALAGWQSQPDPQQRGDELPPRPGYAAVGGAEEVSVRRLKIAEAIEEQLRALAHRPVGRAGRGGESAAAVAFDGVELRSVEINGDLSVATVWWRLEEERAGSGSADGLNAEREAASRLLRRSGAWLRQRVGRSLALRKVPTLRFRHVEHSGGRRGSKRLRRQQKAKGLAAAFAAIEQERDSGVG